MKLALIAAMTPQRVIGRQGLLPWRLPEDLQRFKALTQGHPIIMGRRTWESLPKKPLPGRRNIVLSRQAGFEAPGAEVMGSLKQAVGELAPEYGEAFVIGGEALFREALPIAERLYLTLIQHPFEGDVYFPPYDPGAWRATASTKAVAAAGPSQPAFDYEFIDYIKEPQ